MGTCTDLRVDKGRLRSPFTMGTIGACTGGGEVLPRHGVGHRETLNPTPYQSKQHFFDLGYYGYLYRPEGRQRSASFPFDHEYYRCLYRWG